MGHRDSHELRRERNETPRSGPPRAESLQFSVRLPDLPISLLEQSNCKEFAWIIRVGFHHVLYPRVDSCVRSKRPWSVFVAFFIVLAILGPLLPFLFGRIMIIQTFTRVGVATLPLSFIF